METARQKQGHLCVPGCPPRARPGARVLSHPDPAPSPGQSSSSWVLRHCQISCCRVPRGQNQPPAHEEPHPLETQTWRQIVSVCPGEGGRGALGTWVSPDSARLKTGGQGLSPPSRNAMGRTATRRMGPEHSRPAGERAHTWAGERTTLTLWSELWVFHSQVWS